MSDNTTYYELLFIERRDKLNMTTPRHVLTVQTLSKENFRPFGHVLMLDPGIPPFKEDAPIFTDRVPFYVEDGASEFVFAVLYRRAFTFSSMERHLKLSQGFFPISGGPAIIIVAPPTDFADLETVPAADSVRAFLLDRTTSVVLHKGTWHGTIFPLEPAFHYILATRKETTDESVSPLYDGDVQIRDLGVQFEIKL
jgi:ureidoglycolate lyase